MGASASFQIRPAPDGGRVLALAGDWTATGLGRAAGRLRAAAGGSERPTGLDLSALGRIDTAGALALMEGAGLSADRLRAERPDAARLLEIVAAARPPAAGVPHGGGGALRFLTRVGGGVVRFGEDLLGGLAFLGALLAAVAGVMVRPARLRVAPTVALMERAGLDAAPIVATTSFFVGATIAFLGASLLAQFGAQVYAVELVGIGVLREFGVLVTTIILAGRSASSFAAEIGAMRMNQEVDAMRVMGVDPFQALVVPRFLAMLFMTPLLTFVAMAAGLCGGLVVVWTVLDLSPAFFLERMLENVGPEPFWLGLAKAPVLAMIIAAIGCREGLEVGGDVEQLGRRVTSAVVQALFSIIIVDAIFALLFMELGL
jgi:phospholipid/cholesterol/gamma-HCH transport system permease protein